jgi:hypothetical protein
MASTSRNAAGAKATSGKMRRKVFEMEIAKLQVELTCRLWSKPQEHASSWVFKERDTAGKGRGDQPDRRPA